MTEKLKSISKQKTPKFTVTRAQLSVHNCPCTNIFNTQLFNTQLCTI